MATLSWKLLSPGKEESRSLSLVSGVDSRTESVQQMEFVFESRDRLPAPVAREVSGSLKVGGEGGFTETPK